MALVFLAPFRPARRFAEPSGNDPESLADLLADDEGAYRRAFLAAVAAMAGLLADADAEDGVPPSLVGDMVRALDRVLTERGQDILIRAFLIGAAHARDRLPDDGAASVAIRFDLVNELAVRWAAVHGGSMVTAVSDETRRALRGIISRAVRDGTAPRNVARLVGLLVGLTERDALAVGKLRTSLIEEGRSSSAVDRLVVRYANRLLRARAETIARTEILTAANRGQEGLWQQAVSDGLLDPNAWERVWIVARDERLCTVCRPLDRTRAPLLGGAFEGGLTGPPAHPRCRCTSGLVERT